MRLDQKISQLENISRNKAQELIKNSLIRVNDQSINKPSFIVNDEDSIEVLQNDRFVSRSAYKLKHFIDDFGLNITDKLCLDIGSSSGGFTQVLLEYLASKVVAVDVGTDQLHKSLRSHPQIELFEQCDIREFEYHQKFDLVVSDISFISLSKIIEKIDRLASDQIVLLFKPQFEVGKDAARDSKGVVTNQDAIEKAQKGFEKECSDLGWQLLNRTKSKLAGKDGNIEFLYHYRKA